MTTVSDPAAPPAPVRPTGPRDVLVALLLIVAELVLGWFTYDIASALSRHLDATRPVQWFFLMLPFLPLAIVVAVRALSPARAVAAGLVALGGGAVLIAHNEVIRWIFERQVINPSFHELQALGYVAIMAVAVLATLAWGLSRRHGRAWLLGLLVAAAGAALTLWTDWPSHVGWGHTEFATIDGDDNPFRRFYVVHAVAQLLPVVAACVVCWLIDVAELRRTSAGPTYDEGPPPR
jgi:hypothetical protein